MSERVVRIGVLNRGSSRRCKEQGGHPLHPVIVSLLEMHLAHLEEQAELQMGSIVPLKTNISVERGNAPGAGFQAEYETSESNDRTGPDIGHSNRCRDEVVTARVGSKTLLLLSKQFGTGLTLRDICALLACRVSPLVQSQCIAVYLKKEDLLILAYSQGIGEPNFSSDPIRIGEGISGWVAENEIPSLNGNPTVEPNFQASTQTLFEDHSSALAIPLFKKSGDLLGVLSLYATARTAFSKHHLEILHAFQADFSLALQSGQSSSPSRMVRLPEDDSESDRNGCSPALSSQGNPKSRLEESVAVCTSS